jgi:hypothetical protein
MSGDDNSNLKKIDLAYDYIKDEADSLNKDIQNLRTRAATFLAFSGVLLRFIIQLSDSQPSYKLTKVLAFFTCFLSILLLGWALKSTDGDLSVNPATSEKYMEGYAKTINIFLKHPPEMSKRMLIDYYARGCQGYFLYADEIRRSLNISIILLILTAFLFMVNGILVTFLGK